MKDVVEINRCLACDSDSLDLILNLNNQPLANNYIDAPIPESEFFPLAVNKCSKCYHLQLTHIVNPELIYKNYAYVSGTSQTYKEYMWWFAKWVREYTNQWRGAVLDIGCNDGSQLDAFSQLGYNTFGVDPAENLYQTSSSKKHKIVLGFWEKSNLSRLQKKNFNIVISQNAFAHNPNPVEYLKLVNEILDDDGYLFIQTSQANMISNNEFDTIYHEHISFYNIKSMKAVVERAGMYLVDVVKTPIHGISYIFIISKKNLKAENIANLIEMEKDLYIDQTYNSWRNKVLKVVDEFKQKIQAHKQDGYKIIGYGAAAKGNTLLNFAEVKLDYIIDDNPLKQSKMSPGQNICIVSIDHLAEYTQNDKILFVPLAWNFFVEIKNRIKKQRNNENDRFLKYFPEVNVEF